MMKLFIINDYQSQSIRLKDQKKDLKDIFLRKTTIKVLIKNIKFTF